MKTKLHKSTLLSETNYWYIFRGGGKCQLLMVSIDEDEYKGKFNVMVSTDSDIFSVFPIQIDTDIDGFIENLFEYEDKNDAEIMWVHNFIKDFTSNTSIDYTRFLQLAKQLEEEHPELVLKGL